MSVEKSVVLAILSLTFFFAINTIAAEKKAADLEAKKAAAAEGESDCTKCS